MRAHESSRNFLDSRSRVYRIPTDWPGPANFQQPLNYGRIPWSASRISPSHHVHSPGGAPTKTCFDCTFHRRNPAGLGHFPRKPRLGAKAKALIQTGRTEAGALSFFTPFIGDMPRTLPLHRMILSVNACLKTAINHLNSPVNAGVEKRAQLNGAFGPMLIIQCLASLSDVSWTSDFALKTGIDNLGATI